MRISKIASFSILLVALFIFVAEGTVVPALDLDSLVQDSSLIVTGRIVSLRDEGRTTISNGELLVEAQAYTATLRVDHILKGTASSGDTVFSYYLPTVNIGWSNVLPSQYAVFFFRNDAGKLEFTSAYHPYLPTVPGTVSEVASPIRKVVSALENSLSSPIVTLDQKAMTIFYLTRSKSSAATEALRAAVCNADRELSLDAVAGLLERNDTSALEAAKKALLEPTPEISARVVHNLTYSISEGVTDTDAIPVLNQLSYSNRIEVRRAVASALVHIKSPTSKDLQIRLLSDADFETRYYAAVGLAESAGQKEWHPSMEQFRAEESRYVSHWRETSQ